MSYPQAFHHAPRHHADRIAHLQNRRTPSRAAAMTMVQDLTIIDRIDAALEKLHRPERREGFVAWLMGR